MDVRRHKKAVQTGRKLRKPETSGYSDQRRRSCRGPVVDEEALIIALEKKKIAGAGLDVFIKEPIDLENPLLKFDNVIVTPHCAGCSEEALTATSLMVSREAVSILRGQTPKNLVNRSQLLKSGYRI